MSDEPTARDALFFRCQICGEIVPRASRARHIRGHNLDVFGLPEGEEECGE